MAFLMSAAIVLLCGRECGHSLTDASPSITGVAAINYTHIIAHHRKLPDKSVLSCWVLSFKSSVLIAAVHGVIGTTSLQCSLVLSFYLVLLGVYDQLTYIRTVQLRVCECIGRQCSLVSVLQVIIKESAGLCNRLTPLVLLFC